MHLLEDGTMVDTEERPHLFLGGAIEETYEKEPFPLPFVLVFAGYSFILLIDRVMFDSHALFEHDHKDEGHGHEDKNKKVGPAEHKIGSLNHDRMSTDMEDYSND